MSETYTLEPRKAHWKDRLIEATKENPNAEYVDLLRIAASKVSEGKTIRKCHRCGWFCSVCDDYGRCCLSVTNA